MRRGMYAGYGAFLLRDLPFDAIEFWAFDTLNMRMQKSFGRELNPIEHGMCGAVAGAVTGTLHMLPLPRLDPDLHENVLQGRRSE